MSHLNFNKMNIDIRQIGLSFPDTTEDPHFKAIAFKVRKKVFFTHNAEENRICVKLNEIDQSAFSAAGKGKIYPVPNKWGKQGWTLVELEGIHPELLMDSIKTAYDTVAATVPIKKRKQ